MALGETAHCCLPLRQKNESRGARARAKRTWPSNSRRWPLHAVVQGEEGATCSTLASLCFTHCREINEACSGRQIAAQSSHRSHRRLRGCETVSVSAPISCENEYSKCIESGPSLPTGEATDWPLLRASLESSIMALVMRMMLLMIACRE